MIIYGRNPVREAIRGPRTVKRVWASSGAGREPWLAPLTAITSHADPVELERLCGSDGHQGVCAEVSPFTYADADELLASPGALIIALDQVQDPQNLGAIARTAECAGATGLILPERRSAEVTPAVCKASAGAVEHLLTSWPPPSEPACGATARMRRPRARTGRSTSQARPCSCWALRGEGCDHGWRVPATRSSRSPCAARSTP